VGRGTGGGKGANMTVGGLRKLLEHYPADMEVATESMDFEHDYEPANNESIYSKRVVSLVKGGVVTGWSYPENASGQGWDLTSECEIIVIGY